MRGLFSYGWGSETMNLVTSSGFTVWFTGMSGAGKSTLASALANRLRRLGKTVDILDGSDVQNHLGIGKAQIKDERNAEARKLAWVCRLVTRGGGIVLQSAIESPYRETRDEARRQIVRFAEVFVECPIDTLISRDRTGKYKKALAGELKNLVGISEPYEPPTHPELIIDTAKYSVDEAVEHMMGQLVALRFLDPSLAGLKSRPRVSARSAKSPAPKPVPVPKAPKPAPAPAAAKPGAKVAAAKPQLVKPSPAPAPKPGKPSKGAQRAPAAAKQARPAARTAEVPRVAAGSKRKR